MAKTTQHLKSTTQYPRSDLSGIVFPNVFCQGIGATKKYKINGDETISYSVSTVSTVEHKIEVISLCIIDEIFAGQTIFLQNLS